MLEYESKDIKYEIYFNVYYFQRVRKGLEQHPQSQNEEYSAGKQFFQNVQKYFPFTVCFLEMVPLATFGIGR